MQDMKDSFAKGRHFRTLKIEIELATRKLQNDHRDTYQTYHNTKHEHENLKRSLSRDRRGLTAVDKRALRQSGTLYRAAQRKRQQLKNRLEEAEQDWIVAMRKVNHQH